MKPIGDRLDPPEPPPLRRKRGAPTPFAEALAAAPRPREPRPAREVGAPDLERAVLDWLAAADVPLGPATPPPAPQPTTPTAPPPIDVSEVVEIVELVPFPDLPDPALEVELERYEPPEPEPALTDLISAWHRSLPEADRCLAPIRPAPVGPAPASPAPIEVAPEVAAISIEEIDDVDVIDEVDEPRGVIGPKLARVTVGEGDTRVELTVATAGHTVRVTAVAEDVRLATAIGRGADELAEGLARHGLELGDLRAGHGQRDLDDPEPEEPQPRDDDDVQYAGVRAIC